MVPLTSEGGLGNPSAVTLMGSAGGGSLWGSEKGSPAPALAVVFLDSSEPDPDTESELATLSSARIGPPGILTATLAAMDDVDDDCVAADDGAGGATLVGGLGSLDEATTVACPEAVTRSGSMDDPAGSRSEVEVDVWGGGPIEEEGDEVLVLVLAVVGAVAGIDLVLICAGAELVAAAAEVADVDWPGLLKDGCTICKEEGEGILLA